MSPLLRCLLASALVFAWGTALADRHPHDDCFAERLHRLIDVEVEAGSTTAGGLLAQVRELEDFACRFTTPTSTLYYPTGETAYRSGEWYYRNGQAATWTSAHQ